MPLVKSGISLAPDMKFGWKPTALEISVPIPLYFDYDEETEMTPLDKRLQKRLPILYYGFRPKDSLVMHQEFLTSKANCLPSNYPFKFPPKLPENVQRYIDEANGLRA